MNETPTIAVADTPTLPPKRPLWRRILRIVDRVLAVIVILIALICLFLQTGWFRSLVIAEIERIVSEETNGVLTIGEISGNFLSGVTISDLKLSVYQNGKTSELVSINNASIRYSLFSLLAGNRLTIKDIVLRSPVIRLYRPKDDSLWNFQRLIKPSTSTDTTPSTQLIWLKSIRIENGTLISRDESDTLPANSHPVFHLSNAQFEHIDLDMSARLKGDREQEVSINHLSFKERSSGLHLYRLTMNARRNNNLLSVDTLLLTTSKSTLAMKASLDSMVHLSSDIHRKNIPVHLELDAQAISTEELAAFLPSLDMLAGTPSLMLKAEGTLGTFHIRSAELDLGRGGKLRVAGTITDLQTPDAMHIDISAQGGGFSDATMRMYMPGIDVGDLNKYGVLTFNKVHYWGTMRIFSAELDIASSTVGSVQGTVGLDFNSDQPTYDALLEVGSVNAGVILADSAFASNINLAVKVSGKGFDPKSMQTEFSISSIGDNRLMGYAMRQFQTSGTFSNNIITAKNTQIILDDGGSMQSEYALMDFSQKNPHYDIALTFDDVPVNRYIRQLNPSVRVSLDAHLSGDGFSPESVQGSIHSEVKHLTYRESNLAPVRVDVVLQRNPDGSRSDRINGDIADLTLDGRYSFAHLASEVSKHLGLAASAFAGKTDSVETTVSRYSNQDSLIHADYSFHIKDLRPLTSFFDGQTILAEGRVRGKLREHTDGSLTIQSEGTIDRLLYKPVLTDSTPSEAGIRIYDSMKFSLLLENISESRKTLLDLLRANVTLQSDSSIRIDGAYITRPNIDLSFQNRKLDYHISAGVADMFRTYLQGKGSITDEIIALPIDTLALDFGNNFVWQTERSPIINYDRESSRLTLDTLTLYRPDLGYDPERLLAQRLKVGFDLDKDSLRSFYFETPQLKLRDIPLFFTKGERREEYLTLTGRITQLSIHGSGKITEPNVTASLLVRNVTYNEVAFDSCLVNLALTDKTLRGVSIFHVDTAKFTIETKRYGRQDLALPSNNRLFVVIDSFPLDLFGSSDSRPRPFAIRASGYSYPLNMFSPFVPVIGDLHGLFDADVRLTGIGDSIRLLGSVQFTKSTFTVLSTNVSYAAEGSLSLTENELRFDNVSIRNQRDDDPEGKAQMQGSIAFKGFVPGEFDFTLSTPRLTVLTNGSQLTLKNVYGPLAMKTLSRPLRFYGTMDEPHINGDIALVEGYLTFPQNVAAASNLASGDIIYRIRIPESYDTSDIIDTVRSILVESVYDIEDARTVRTIRGSTVRPTETAALRTSDKQEIPFSDRLLYDLSVSIPGDVWIDIYFNRALGLTGEQLNAELLTDRSLRLSRSVPGAPLQILGELSVTDRSSYKFIREFRPVFGTLSFYNEITNPNLNLTAEYESKHETRNDYYKVRLKITGTALLPILQIQLLKRNDVTGNYEKLNTPADEQQTDALFFLAQGSLRSDLDDQQKFNAVNNLVTPIGTKIAGSLLNSVIGNTELSSYIRNVSFEEGAPLSKIKLTGAYQKVKWNIGQQILKSQDGSSDYTLELPASQFFSFPYANNLILFGEAHILSASSQQTSILSKPPFGGSILIRIPF